MVRIAVAMVALVALVGCVALAEGAPPASGPGTHGLKVLVFQGMHAGAPGAASETPSSQPSGAARHAIVWVNGRPADLEHAAISQKGNIYITLTDLMRHLGGMILWSPSVKWIEVKRSGETVRVVSGSDKVTVNGETRPLGAPTFSKDSMLWVPIKPFAGLFGVPATWDGTLHRLEVTVP